MTKPLALDLSKRHATFAHGSVTAILSWLQTDRRPCLVLIPTLALLHYDRVRPYVIPLDMAYMWDEHTGDGGHCAQASMKAAEQLGFAVNPRVCFKLTDIIREHLGDLLSCPPMPILMQTEVAIATVTNRETGKVVTQTGINEDV
jgi:hypothetical protein